MNALKPPPPKPMTKGVRVWRLGALLAACAVLAACGPRVSSSNGYHVDVVPGITRERCIELLGKPQDAQTFSLPNTIVQADVLTYPFGQILVQNGVVVAVSLDDEPAFVGPFGVKLGMLSDDLRARKTP